MRGFFDYIFFKQKKVKKKLKISWGQASGSGLIRGHDIRANKKRGQATFSDFLSTNRDCPLSY